MRIGNVNAQDRVKQLKDAAADPYANEPPRHPAMQVLSMRPFNSEPPRDLLALSFFTPNDIFYVRNHLPVPHVQKEGYAVSVKFGRIEKKFTLDDLRKFPQVTVPVTLQCAGNRRRGMSSLRSVDGLMWDTGAISTATWTGVRLADVLRKVGVTDDGARKKGWKHVVFEGHDGGPDGKYGASISYDRATDAEADVILAWEMNGTELPKDHGFPLRVVVPGLVGARSVKWLNSIEVSEKESQSIWQQKDYKNIGPSFLDRLTAAAAAKEAPPVKEMPVQSAILIPDDSEGIKADQETVIASGYACGGGGRGIHRVDVTPDNGNTWIPAELYETDEGKTEGNKTYGKLIDRPMPQQWAWTLWRAEVPVSLKKKEFELCAKAVNTANDTQPETPKGIWNLRGLLNNSWHCIHIKRDE
ncbi:putative sulfite oxidase [Diplonema papillatum]|nr:putative sulfite oxidase [Diplonema papillatum]